MKILQCKRGQIYDIGFIDPYYIHEETLRKWPNRTDNNLVDQLMFNETKREILFPYNFE